ncbi:alpha/beta hydrolase fold family protein [Aureobasidium sp. EXF-8845]|nr:alpha/beta hydrolase fold family protein [Aureobasidium sp. EXF-8845]KAI4846747.1 alpha/beta hydrolase fold family protein [Aureobasidium sp. EXF-8846]
MPNTKIIHVPHLGGIEASYQTPGLSTSRPTLVLVNSFTTSSELYKTQYANKDLTDKMNLLAIELLGHGQTRCKLENWTYWDTAWMNIQVLQELEKQGKIDQSKGVFVLGTSQGGWITVRMALLAPDKITGIIPLGTSLDFESPTTREIGCWNAPQDLTPDIEAWSKPSDDSFRPGNKFSDFLIDIGFGKDCDSSVRDFWRNEIANNYIGDDGRKRARMATINLRDRDGLHGRLADVECPVLWLHGTADAVYSVANAKREIEMFVGSPDAQLKVVQDGQHFLSFSHPEEVDAAVAEFVAKYS